MSSNQIGASLPELLLEVGDVLLGVDPGEDPVLDVLHGVLGPDVGALHRLGAALVQGAVRVGEGVRVGRLGLPEVVLEAIVLVLLGALGDHVVPEVLLPPLLHFHELLVQVDLGRPQVLAELGGGGVLGHLQPDPGCQVREGGGDVHDGEGVVLLLVGVLHWWKNLLTLGNHIWSLNFSMEAMILLLLLTATAKVITMVISVLLRPWEATNLRNFSA